MAASILSASNETVFQDGLTVGSLGPTTGSRQVDLVDLVEPLRRTFGVGFHVVDGETGELLYRSPEQPECDWLARAELCREVARRDRPEVLADEPPLVMLAVPVSLKHQRSYVAVALLVTRLVSADEDLSPSAQALGLRPPEAATWASRQTPWAPEALERVAGTVLEGIRLHDRLHEVEKESQSLSVNLAATYEEISLLYRITQNLKISESDEELGRLALEWMEEVIPAEALAIQYVPVVGDREAFHPKRTQSQLLTLGQCPLDNETFSRLMEHLRARSANRPIVLNRPVTGAGNWPFPQIRQMIAVPLAEGENLFGWLAAFNHPGDAEFGTVEASLLNSVAAILGIHSGNIELYHQQAELMAGIIRALTSAIDAKDPYTCGHSDRVARVSVLLARELGCDEKTVNTIYLSGLLHDIGKIGINDNVLRKPGKLTDAEYEHIKTHVRIGHRILVDLKKLDDVLPVVLHHHESFDGKGYPQALANTEIPRSARIVAVADAFDAMGSNRPYRQGMPDEKIDQIFREGSGSQWDPEVVAALFRIRDQVREVSRLELGPPALDVEQLV
jgi:putative nucleotidyltransferase with HDIG domain